MEGRVERERGPHPSQRRRLRLPEPLLRGQATADASFGFCSWQSELSRLPTWLTRCVKRSRSVPSKSPQSPDRSDLERTSMQTILGKFRRCECGGTRSWAAHSDRYGLFPIGLRAIPKKCSSARMPSASCFHNETGLGHVVRGSHARVPIHGVLDSQKPAKVR